MDRYTIALKKFENPEEKPSEAEKSNFGFDDGPNVKIKPFRPIGDFTGRVGLVYADKKEVFMANKTHYFNSKYYICKNSDCCSYGKAAKRYVCCLVVYNSEHKGDLDLAQVVPWNFSSIIFEKILHMSKTVYPLYSNDFALQYTTKKLPHLRWDVQPLNPERSASLWQSCDNNILQRATPILKTLESFIGENNVDDIDFTGMQKIPKSINISPISVPKTRRLRTRNTEDIDRLMNYLDGNELRNDISTMHNIRPNDFSALWGPENQI